VACLCDFFEEDHVRFHKNPLLPLIILSITACLEVTAAPAEDSLAQGFQSPPQSARPRVWWHWMNGNITKDGIDKDLHWMSRVGIGGLQNFDGAYETPQVVDKRLAYMTPEWQDAFRYATKLADQLNLELAIASSPGWSETGGPWVEPKDGMKKLVWSVTRIQGGRPFKGQLAAPPAIAGPYQDVSMVDVMSDKDVEGPRFYRDATVIAYRTPKALRQEPKPVEVTTNAPSVDTAPLHDKDLSRLVSLPIDSSQSVWVLYDYGKPQQFRAAAVARPLTRAFAWSIEASEDGKTFRSVASLPRDYFIYHATVSFPAVTARYMRLAMKAEKMPMWADMGANAPGAEIPGVFDRAANEATLSELEFFSGARVNRFEEKAGFSIAPEYYSLDNTPSRPDDAVDPKAVIDLSGKLRSDGTLDWKPPAGDWTVLRLGYSLTGKTNHPASAEATGLEVDKLDKRAVKGYLDNYLGQFEKTVGPDLIGKHGIRAFLTDSIESSGQNWTSAMIAEFKTRRGYDLTPWFPALTGVIVGDAARTDRFLWDFRQTLRELIAESHYGQVAESAHERGLVYYNESLEGYPTMAMGDDLDMRQHGDIPMAAFWTSFDAEKRDGILNHIVDIRGAASVSHFYGQNLVAAESLTSAAEPWAYSPATLQPLIDLEFVLGVNRPVIHTSAHQPTEQKPGMTLGPFGQFFTRHETWGEMAAPWVTYLARNAYLLQQGKHVGDVAWFYGEDGPVAGLYDKGTPANLPEGYGFDFVNANMLLNHSSAKDGRLSAPSGASYRLLYLGGNSERMTLPVLRKLKELAGQGIAIAGERPKASPSLSDEGKEGEYQQLVGELWDSGKIKSGGSPDEILERAGVARDFEYSKAQPDARVLFLHRSLADGDLYFLSNRKPRREKIEAHFRVTGKKPELWHADTGEREAVSWRIEAGRTIVPLDLYAHQSVFVVFRDPTEKTAEDISFPQERTIATVKGDWQLSFEPGRGAPVAPVSTSLGSWSQSKEAGIRYFSGVGTYKKTFSVRAADLKGGRIELDLGQVYELAEVTLNGKSVGMAWHPPYRLDVTPALKPGTNTIEIRVANLWVNRLIGDKQPGATPVAFTVTQTYKPDAPLRASGLLGPVTLVRRAP
jgi:hypothetical protein